MGCVVWNGRGSDYIANGLNKLLKYHRLPYRAEIHGEPKCYDTPRYGGICNYDFLPVCIVDEHGNPVEARMDITWEESYEESGFGVAYGGGNGEGELIIYTEGGAIVIPFKITRIMHDYIYKYYIDPVGEPINPPRSRNEECDDDEECWEEDETWEEEFEEW